MKTHFLIHHVKRNGKAKMKNSPVPLVLGTPKRGILVLALSQLRSPRRSEPALLGEQELSVLG